jgi:RNA polymerase sigma-70 factor (sigma-E family)
MRGERRADFDDFVRAEATSLFRTAYLLVGNRPGAEDLLQDALERTYRRWGSVAIDQPAAYVRRAMANLASNQWRWRRRQPAPVHLLEDGDGASADRRLAPDATDAVHQRQDLLAALTHLPPRQRVVVVLRYWDDVSERDTARTIGCSVGAVKRHASRGLARLRQVLDEPPPGSRLVGSLTDTRSTP